MESNVALVYSKVMDNVSLDYLHQQKWFQKLPSIQKEFLQQSIYLLEEAGKHDKVYFDYAYVVMPAAKAFEGFIKDLLLGLGMITKNRYKGKRFRVGKALNPEISRQHPDSFEVLYDDLTRYYGDESIPYLLWQTWRECRNKVFHYFIEEFEAISLGDARKKVMMVFTAIEKTSEK